MFRGLRGSLVGIFCVCLLAACGNPGLWSRQFDLGPPPKVKKLPSGMQLVVGHDERLPLVAVSLVVRAGSAQDPPGKAGLAHLVEHLSSDGQRKTGLTVDDQLQQVGSTNNARTEFDYTAFYAVAPTTSWRELLSAQISRIADPLAGVDEATFRRELDVVRNEYWQKFETHGAGAALASLQQLVYDVEDPYSNSVAGTPHGLASLTLADAQAFAKRYYRPKRATLYLDGAVPADIDGDLEELLSLAPSTAAPSTAPAKPTRLTAAVSKDDQRIVKTEARVSGPELWIGWAAPSVFGAQGWLVEMVAEFARAQLASTWLHSEDPEIIDVDVDLLSGRRGSLLVCRARLMNEANPERAARVIRENVANLWAARLPVAASWGQRRNILQNAALMSQESLLQRAQDWPVFAHFTGDPRFFLHRLGDALANFDYLGTSDFIRKQFAASRAHVVYVTPSASSPKLSVTRPNASVQEKSVASLPFPESPAALAELLRGHGLVPDMKRLANHQWNMGWSLSAGRSALASLTQIDPDRNAALAKQCHDSAAVVVAASDLTLARLRLQRQSSQPSAQPTQAP